MVMLTLTRDKSDRSFPWVKDCGAGRMFIISIVWHGWVKGHPWNFRQEKTTTVFLKTTWRLQKRTRFWA